MTKSLPTAVSSPVPDTHGVFMALQGHIVKTLEEQGEEMRARALTPEVLVSISSIVAIYAAWFLGLFIFLPPLSQILIGATNTIESVTIRQMLQSIRLLVLPIAVGGFLLVLLQPGLHLISRTEDQKVKTGIRLLQALVFNVAWLVSIGRIFALVLDRDATSSHLLNETFAAFLLVAVPGGLAGWIAAFVIKIMPSIVLLILPSTSLRTLFSGIPSHDDINMRSIEGLSLQLERCNAQLLEEVGFVAECKHDALNSQVQAVSVVVGIFGLVSVVSLFCSGGLMGQADVAMQRFFSDVLLIETGEIVPISSQVAPVFAGVFLVLILIGITYFTSTYQSLRTLEVVQLACRLSFGVVKQREAQEIEKAKDQRMEAVNQDATSIGFLSRGAVADWLNKLARWLRNS
jgi:hypothetical protein